MIILKNKRLILRNKYTRLYEEDIWGIFWKKQKKRNFFFKHISYQFFLEILYLKILKESELWKKKIIRYTLIRDVRYLFKNNFNYFSIFSKFFWPTLNSDIPLKSRLLKRKTNKIIIFKNFLIFKYVANLKKLLKLKEYNYVKSQLKWKIKNKFTNKSNCYGFNKILCESFVTKNNINFSKKHNNNILKNKHNPQIKKNISNNNLVSSSSNKLYKKHNNTLLKNKRDLSVKRNKKKNISNNNLNLVSSSNKLYKKHNNTLWKKNKRNRMVKAKRNKKKKISNNNNVLLFYKNLYKHKNNNYVHLFYKNLYKNKNNIKLYYKNIYNYFYNTKNKINNYKASKLKPYNISNIKKYVKNKYKKYFVNYLAKKKKHNNNIYTFNKIFFTNNSKLYFLKFYKFFFTFNFRFLLEEYLNKYIFLANNNLHFLQTNPTITILIKKNNKKFFLKKSFRYYNYVIPPYFRSKNLNNVKNTIKFNNTYIFFIYLCNKKSFNFFFKFTKKNLYLKRFFKNLYIQKKFYLFNSKNFLCVSFWNKNYIKLLKKRNLFIKFNMFNNLNNFDFINFCYIPFIFFKLDFDILKLVVNKIKKSQFKLKLINNNFNLFNNCSLYSNANILHKNNFYIEYNSILESNLILHKGIPINIFTNIYIYYKKNYLNNNVFLILKNKASNVFILNSFFGNCFSGNKIVKNQINSLNKKHSIKFYTLNNFNLFFINFFNNNVSFIYMLRFFYSLCSLPRYGFFNNIFIVRKYYPIFYFRFFYYLKKNFFNFSIINLKLLLNKFIFIYFFKYNLNYTHAQTIFIVNNLNALLKLNKRSSFFYNFCYYFMCISFFLSESLYKKILNKNNLYLKFFYTFQLKNSTKTLFSNIFSTFNFFNINNFFFFYTKYYNLFGWSFFKSLFLFNFNFSEIKDLADIFLNFFNNLINVLEKNTLRILFKRLFNFKISTIFINNYSSNLLRDFLFVRFKEWSTFTHKVGFFVNKNTSNTTQWARRQVKRSLFALQNFIYFRFNKFVDAYDLPPILDFDGLYKTLHRNNNVMKYNGYLINYIHWIKTQNPFFFKNKRKDVIKIITSKSIVFNKTEYLLSFYASNRVYKFFNKARGRYISQFYTAKKKININLNNFSYAAVPNNNKLALKYYKSLRLKLKSIKKRLIFYSIKKRKTQFQKLFTLNLIHVMKYVKKKTSFCSFYKYRMLKLWKFRKFYGCLTDFELFSICRKAYKMHGDILHQFIMLLECRLDTLLFRSGLVSTMFEARQFINHGNVLVNNSIVTRRSYIVQFTDFICIKPNIFLKLKNKIINRLNIEGLITNPPVYLEINYNYFMIFFLHDILKASQVPFNFKLTGYDINNILYYYY